MNTLHIKVGILSGFLFLALLISSLISYNVIEGDTVKRTFFFPHDIYGTLNSEIRKLPLKETLEEDIELYIKEVLLGPATYISDHLLPEDTSLQTVILGEETVYIDFAEEIMFTDTMPIPFERSVGALIKSVKFNFPDIETVIITINGQQISKTFITEWNTE